MPAAEPETLFLYGYSRGGTTVYQTPPAILRSARLR